MNEIKNKEELKKFLESLSASNYSHIPKNLLSLILDELSLNSDNAKALEKINGLVREHLKK